MTTRRQTRLVDRRRHDAISVMDIRDGLHGTGARLFRVTYITDLQRSREEAEALCIRWARASGYDLWATAPGDDTGKRLVELTGEIEEED